MRRARRFVLTLLASVSIGVRAAPADAAQDPNLPRILSPADREAYRRAFDLLARGKAKQALDAARGASSDILLPGFEAQALLAARPTASAGEMAMAWLAEHGDHPSAPAVFNQLKRAMARGAPMPVSLSEPQATRSPSDTVEVGPRFGQGPDPAWRGRALANAMRPLLEGEQPKAAEALWRTLAGQPDTPAWAYSYWAGRIAWYYYIVGDNESALRMGALGGATQTWEAAAALWIAGLAAWRLDRPELALDNFSAIEQRPNVSPDLRSAGAYWASRAAFALRQPQKITGYLDLAGRFPETFYGLLALRTLGFTPKFDWFPPDFIRADWNQLADMAGARRALALVELGELGRADIELRTLWSHAEAQDYTALVRLAAALDLPATQYWLSQHPPFGQNSPISGRFPAPNWTPHGGWRVDKALVYAFALQESRFVTGAVSRVGARGVMQLMPGTARQLKAAGALAGAEGEITDPTFNLELGQTYLEVLRDSEHTGALLPKVIAAYNAGPGSVKKWNVTLDDRDDPLLFIESIPFAETRHYVERVMGNYWLYAVRLKTPAPSLDAIASGLWPRFPGMPGATAATTGRLMPAAQPSRAPDDAPWFMPLDSR